MQNVFGNFYLLAPLRLETGRYERLNLGQIVCFNCESEIEFCSACLCRSHNFVVETVYSCR